MNEITAENESVRFPVDDHESVILRLVADSNGKLGESYRVEGAAIGYAECGVSPGLDLDFPLCPYSVEESFADD